MVRARAFSATDAISREISDKLFAPTSSEALNCGNVSRAAPRTLTV